MLLIVLLLRSLEVFLGQIHLLEFLRPIGIQSKVLLAYEDAIVLGTRVKKKIFDERARLVTICWAD